MSLSIDQRNKGQSYQPVSNGQAREQPLKEDFESYIPSQPGQYGTMSSPGVHDVYFQPYMTTAYTPFPADAWSSAAAEPMTFSAPGYGQMGDYMSNGMYGGFSQYGAHQPPLRWDFSTSDYAWGLPPNSTTGPKSDVRLYDDYYGTAPVDGYHNTNSELEQDMKNIQLTDKGDEEHVPSNGTGDAVPPPKKTWASIASQPAKNPPPSIKAKNIPRAPVANNRNNLDMGLWVEGGKGAKSTGPGGRPPNWVAPRNSRGGGPQNSQGDQANGGNSTNGAAAKPNSVMLRRLQESNNYNPKEFDLSPKNARFFIIKSYSEDDIHRSIKYSIWCSTEHGNKRLDQAYHERVGKGPIYLFFSVNGSGHFCGMAQMMSSLDYGTKSSVWAQDKWKGQFEVKWIFVKDVPNSQLRHIRLENNENKPVTNSRDTQEVPGEKGRQVLKILNSYRASTSIFDDFEHYEKRQGGDEDEKEPEAAPRSQRASATASTSRNQ